MALNKQIKDFDLKSTPSDTDQVLIQESGGTTKKTTSAGLKNFLNLDSGTFSQTSSALSNADSVVPLKCLYSRVGNIVTLGIIVYVDPTSAGIVSFELDLPIASDFTTANDASGSLNAVNPAQSGLVYSSASNDTLVVSLQVSGTSAKTFYGTVQYEIK
jgi:hypothetical protein